MITSVDKAAHERGEEAVYPCVETAITSIHEAVYERGKEAEAAPMDTDEEAVCLRKKAMLQ